MKGIGKTARLRLLAGVTVVVLAGIISLQVYWLYTSYKDQQSRFKADVENTLVTTILKSQLVNSLPGISSGDLDSLPVNNVYEAISRTVGSILR